MTRINVEQKNEDACTISSYGKMIAIVEDNDRKGTVTFAYPSFSKTGC